VKLAPLVRLQALGAECLRSKTLAVDVANLIYRHLFQIRSPDGSPYRNEDGTRVGHLIGLCNEVSTLYRVGARPLFVFDGEPPSLKEETMRRRALTRDKGGIELDERMKAQMKRTLDLLGTPWVQAPEEAEAQAAFMTKHDCWAAMTNDYDALLFGSRRMVKAFTKRGVDLLDLDEVLQGLGLDRRGLVRVGILVGTDYNSGGIRGLGPIKALKLVREHGSLGRILSFLGREGEEERLLAIEEYYMDPPVCRDWDHTWREPKEDQIRDYLCGDMKLDDAMVTRVVRDIRKALREGSQASQRTLTEWREAG